MGKRVTPSWQKVNRKNWLQFVTTVTVTLPAADQARLAKLSIGHFHTEQVLRTTQEYPPYPEPPTDGSPMPQPYLVPSTQWWLDLQNMKDTGFDVSVGVGVYMLSQSVPLATIATVLRKLHSSVKRLREDEMEVVRMLTRATQGNIYDVAVPEENLLHAWPDKPQDLLELLDSMERRRYLVKQRDGWSVCR